MRQCNFIGVVFLLLGLSLGCKCNAQSLVIDSIKTDAVDFAIDQGYLEKEGKPDDNLKRIYLFELGDEKSLDKGSTSGIYLFTITSSHTERFILVLNEKKREFYTLTNVQRLLSDASLFFLTKNISDEKAIKYLDGIIAAHRYNLTLK